MSNYLYVMELANGAFKIGRSSDVGKRFHRAFYGQGGSINDDPQKPHQPVRVVLTLPCDDCVRAETIARNFLYVGGQDRRAESFFTGWPLIDRDNIYPDQPSFATPEQAKAGPLNVLWEASEDRVSGTFVEVRHWFRLPEPKP